jgi:hypothetical protein
VVEAISSVNLPYLLLLSAVTDLWDSNVKIVILADLQIKFVLPVADQVEFHSHMGPAGRFREWVLEQRKRLPLRARSIFRIIYLHICILYI